MLMTSTLRKLLVVTALCWVAPLGAEQRATSDQASDQASDPAWSEGASGCPYARAEAEAKAAQSDPIVVKADLPLLEHRGPASAFLP
jgi:hypothetical protein